MIYHAVVILLLKVLLIFVKGSTELLAMEFNYPIRNMSDFIRESNLLQFVSNDYGNYTHIVKSFDFIYVVSDAHELLKVSRDSMHLVDKFSSKAYCSKDFCEQIHINVVKFNQEKGMLWFCFAYKVMDSNVMRDEKPKCYLSGEESLTKNMGQWQAQTFTSSDFEHQPVVLTVSQFIYSGLQFVSKKKLQVFKNQLPFSDSFSTKLITRLPSSFLKAPGDFILSFQFQNSIYFLLMETDFSCGFGTSQLQTRLLRLCNDDIGDLNNEFRAYAKINVICEQKSPNLSLPSYTYNVASAATWMPLSNELVVSFISSKSDESSSVLCLYTIRSIEDTFNSDFKKASEKSNYIINFFPNTCHNFSANTQNQDYISNIISISKTYPLRMKILTNFPIFQERNCKIVHVSSDESVWATQRRVVLFLTIKYRHQMAVVIISLHPKFCVLEKFLTTETVTAIQLINYEKPVLYVGTSHRLFSIPMDRCKSYKGKRECLSFFNPYCFWSDVSMNCIFISRESEMKSLSELGQVCPQISKEVEEVSSKLERTCPLYSVDNQLKPIGSCTCRSVDSGQIVTVAKYCKVDGNWSPFSDWSDCSVTCDTGTQSRSRSCDNPSPMNGGKICKGVQTELRSCTTKIPCQKSTNGDSQLEQFSSWSAWSACSATCGLSFTVRTRNCLSGNCKDNSSERRLCRYPACHSSITSDWSVWSTFNSVTSSRRRLRAVCTQTYFYKPSPMAVIFIRGQSHIGQCIAEECFAKNPERVRNGRWTVWSSRSPCSVSCGAGITTRSRQCSNDKCLGSSTEVSQCNTHPCKSTWSCWSDWTSCATTCETPKTRTRHRYCIHDHFNRPCIGSNIEELECALIPCTSSYTQWGVWSACSNDGHATRTRKCKSKRPCLLLLTQVKQCAVASTNRPVLYSSIYMIVSGLLGLFVGVLIGSVICYIWWRCTIMVIHKAHSGSIRFTSPSQRDEIYASQSLNTLPDYSMHRQRSTSNNDTYYQNQYLPPRRDDTEYYRNHSPAAFFDNSSSFTGFREPLQEEAEI